LRGGITSKHIQLLKYAAPVCCSNVLLKSLSAEYIKLLKSFSAEALQCVDKSEAEKGRVLKLISDAALSKDQAALSEDQAPCSAICYYCCIIEEQVNDM
jgi:hypothetical protein